MPRIAWLTDLHFDFISAREEEQFLEEVRQQQSDVVLLGGDLADARKLPGVLRAFAERLSMPVFFVLGNHDFYYGSIREVREATRAICKTLPSLHYLTQLGVIELSADLGLVGHDGWADARYGDYEQSMVSMNDYRLIAELSWHNKEGRWPVLKALGDEAAAHVERYLPEALTRYSKVLFLTHVPPLREACWHEGQISDDEWLPHFSCKAVGQALLRIMRQFPDRELTVLCGHTHGSGECRPLPNLLIRTGGAIYGRPAVQDVWSE